MRVVLQRVSQAAVHIDGDCVGEIGQGHLILVGFRDDDGPEQLTWMLEKILGLRVFPDDEGRMNLGLEEVGGELLIVSQFTLYGDTSKGRRPSFVHAAHPDLAIPLYEQFVAMARARLPDRVQTGQFGAMMDVSLVNDGPVTLVLER